MNLKTMLFGGYSPPDVPGRVITTDPSFTPYEKRAVFKVDAAKYAKAIKKAEGNRNTQRIKELLKTSPGATAAEIVETLKLSKSPVYKNLLQFKEDGNVTIGKRRVGNRTIITYKWVEGK